MYWYYEVVLDYVLTEFGSLVEFISDKTPASYAELDSYVTTENMLPDFGGVQRAKSLPASGGLTVYKHDDILFSNIRTYFKKAWQSNRSGTCSNDVLVFRSKDVSTLSPDYLFHIVRWNKFTEMTVRTSKGAKMPRGDKEEIARFQVYIPSLDNQKVISAILGALDRKIELNAQASKTLEAMAQAIFKDWFVDFGPTRAKMEGREPYLPPEIWDLFPDTLDNEGKPIGWSRKPLDEVADFLNGLALQKHPASDIENSLPVIKIAELRGGVTSRSDRASRELPEQYIVRDGDFIFSWSGSLLAKFWTSGEGALNQHLFKVTSERYPAWFYSQWVHHHLAAFRAIASSKATTMGHIQRKHLKQAMTVCPEDEVLSQLSRYLGPFTKQAVVNALESRTLVETRDRFLPKLISGKVDVH